MSVPGLGMLRFTQKTPRSGIFRYLSLSFLVFLRRIPYLLGLIIWRPSMKDDDRWLSVQEIAKHLGAKQETVYVWIREKGMPAHKVGRLWKFKKHEVDDWVRSGTARSQT
jgi:excisionase family DNA binding protein